MNIQFTVMVSDSPERIANAKLLSESIPNLNLFYGHNEDVFQKFIKCFCLDDNIDGLVLLEDDVQLCNNFYNHINSVISKFNVYVISFFEKPNSKKTLKTSFQKGRDFLFNQCNYYPKYVCDLIINPDNINAFKEQYKQKWVCPSDSYVAFCLDKYNIDYLMYLPFLVQHLPFKSTLGNRSTKRQTKFFIDDL